MNGLSFQGKILDVKRRVFKNPDYEGLSRTEIRKLKAKKAAEKRRQGSGPDNDDDKAHDIEMSESAVGESSSASAKSDSGTFARPSSPTYVSFFCRCAYSFPSIINSWLDYVCVTHFVTHPYK